MYSWLTDICRVSHPVAMIELHELEESQVSVESVRGWCVEEQAMEMDIAVLQQVEELERKVTAASLQVKVKHLHKNTNTLYTFCSLKTMFKHGERCNQGTNALTVHFLSQGWTYPDPQSEREDLVYYEHKPPTKSAAANAGDKDSKEHPEERGEKGNG